MGVYADCDVCDRPANEMVCNSCADSRALDHVRDWLTAERLKIGTDITPEVAAVFERCIEDLR